MRFEVTVQGTAYSYLAVYQGNERGGVALTTFAAHEPDFTALMSKLHLR